MIILACWCLNAGYKSRTVALVTRDAIRQFTNLHIYNVLQKKFKFIPLIHIYDWLIVTCWNKIIKIPFYSKIFILFINYKIGINPGLWYTIFCLFHLQFMISKKNLFCLDQNIIYFIWFFSEKKIFYFCFQKYCYFMDDNLNIVIPIDTLEILRS